MNDVRNLDVWVQTHIRTLIPHPGFASDKILGHEGRVPIKSEGWHVEVELSLAHRVRIEAADDQNDVVPFTLAERDEAIVRTCVEGEVAQAVKCRMFATPGIESSQVRGECLA